MKAGIPIPLFIMFKEISSALETAWYDDFSFSALAISKYGCIFQYSKLT